MSATLPLFIAIFCSFLITSGQVLWKVGLNQNGGLLPEGQTVLQSLIALLTSPAMWAGCAAYMVATLLWMYLIGKHPLSYVFPMLSLTFVFSLAFAALLFHEPITMAKLGGLVLILSGVAVIHLNA